MDPQRAIDFCKQHGNPLEQHRIAFLFENGRDDDDALDLVGAEELVEGGFPYKLKDGNPPCLNETVVRLGTILELDLQREPIADRTCRFLLSAQLPDGGWDEDHRLLELNPPGWDRPGDTKTRTWLSGEIIRQVAKVVGAENGNLRRGCDFLLKHFDGTKIVGFPIATGTALGAMSLTNRDEAASLLPMAQSYSAIEPDPAFANWFLECLVDHGLTLGDTSVVGLVRKLEGSQRRDGSWGTGDGAATVNTTINALKHLKWAKRW